MTANCIPLDEGAIAAAVTRADADTGFAWAIATDGPAERPLRWLSEPAASGAELSRGEIQLWMAAIRPQPAAPGAGFTLGQAAALLDAEETGRMLNLRREDDRRLHAAAHAGKRLMLASALGKAPESLRFAASPHGKPGLGGEEAGRSDFSLSHAGEVVMVAIARDPVGADVEPLDAGERAAAMIDLVLAAEEQALWRAAPEHLQGRLFLRYWTLKEALLKAAGLGFAVPPSAIRIDAGAPSVLAVPPALGAPSRWRLLAPTDSGLALWMRDAGRRAL